MDIVEELSAIFYRAAGNPYIPKGSVHAGIEAVLEELIRRDMKPVKFVSPPTPDERLVADARGWQHGRFGAAEPIVAELIGRLADRLEGIPSGDRRETPMARL